MSKNLLLLLVLSLLNLTYVTAQNRLITGKITSQDDGLPLSGVNVILKGSSKGTVTNSEGNYSLSIPGTGGNLVFFIHRNDAKRSFYRQRTDLEHNIGAGC